MARIRFRSSEKVIDVPVDTSRASSTLLELARANGVPILFNCEKGSCGACVVKVVSRAEDGRAPSVSRTEREELVLRAMGRLTDERVSAAHNGRDGDGGGVQTRLACLYRLNGENEDIEVEYDCDLACY